jgi:hypothetical protein
VHEAHAISWLLCEAIGPVDNDTMPLVSATRTGLRQLQSVSGAANGVRQGEDILGPRRRCPATDVRVSKTADLTLDQHLIIAISASGADSNTRIAASMCESAPGGQRTR